MHAFMCVCTRNVLVKVLKSQDEGEWLDLTSSAPHSANVVLTGVVVTPHLSSAPEMTGMEI